MRNVLGDFIDLFNTFLLSPFYKTKRNNALRYNNPVALFYEFRRMSYEQLKLFIQENDLMCMVYTLDDFFRFYNKSFIFCVKNLYDSIRDQNSIDTYVKQEIETLLYEEILNFVKEKIERFIQSRSNHEEQKDIKRQFGMTTILLNREFENLESLYDVVYNSLDSVRDIFKKCVTRIVSIYKYPIDKKNIDRAIEDSMKSVEEEGREFEFIENELELSKKLNCLIIYDDNRIFFLDCLFDVSFSVGIIYKDTYNEDDEYHDEDDDEYDIEDYEYETDYLSGNSLDLSIQFFYDKIGNKAFMKILNYEKEEVYLTEVKLNTF